MVYSPKTGAACSCRRGIERDNCAACEGSGRQIDFKAIHARRVSEEKRATRQVTPMERLNKIIDDMFTSEGRA